MEASYGATPSRNASIRAGIRSARTSEFNASADQTVPLLGGIRVSVGRDASADVRIDAVAQRQRGRATREQLLIAGVSPSAIDRRLRNGRLRRLHHSVYGVPHTSDLPLAAETGALLACGEGAVLSYHSAATLWGLRPGEARPVHVTIPAARTGPAPLGVKLHHSRNITPADIRIRDGLPVTSPARTLLDVAATLPDRDFERLLDEALFVRRIVTLREISALLKRAGKHPGRARLARVARSHTRSTETGSRVAEKLYGLIRAAGLPEPQLEVPMLEYRLDLFWPELNLAIEVDSYGTHGSPARFEADRRRDARLLTEKGIVVIRLTKDMIEHRPLEAVGLVARAIGQREAERRSR
jgi:very-short-patch-repair endonuclease